MKDLKTPEELASVTGGFVMGIGLGDPNDPTRTIC